MNRSHVFAAVVAACFLLEVVKANQFFKVKEYDDPSCTEDTKRIQTALYPVDTCLFIGKSVFR